MGNLAMGRSGQSFALHPVEVVCANMYSNKVPIKDYVNDLWTSILSIFSALPCIIAYPINFFNNSC